MGNEDKYAQYPERPSDSRVRYFDGQFLGSQDFIDEQRYHIDRLRRVRLAQGFLGRFIVTGTLLSTGLLRTHGPAVGAPERP